MLTICRLVDELTDAANAASSALKTVPAITNAVDGQKALDITLATFTVSVCTSSFSSMTCSTTC